MNSSLVYYTGLHMCFLLLQTLFLQASYSFYRWLFWKFRFLEFFFKFSHFHIHFFRFRNYFSSFHIHDHEMSHQPFVWLQLWLVQYHSLLISLGKADSSSFYEYISKTTVKYQQQKATNCLVACKSIKSKASIESSNTVYSSNTFLFAEQKQIFIRLPRTRFYSYSNF